MNVDKNISNAKRVGVLGDGQLSRMLCQAARAMGFHSVIHSSVGDSSAGSVADEIFIGEPIDSEVWKKFFDRLEVAAFENEFIDLRPLERLSPVPVIPSLNVMHQLGDKLRQKRCLERLKIPSARFREIKPGGGLETSLREAFEELGGACVLKWSRNGYDGKGVFFAQEDDLSRAMEFCRLGHGKESSVYAEERLSFARELALVSVFSTRGEFTSYPLVVSEQSEGICRKVLGPATALGVSDGLERKAIAYAKALSEDLGLHGVFALELFETDRGGLLVNEIAPRVHNSGHFTIDASETSQFENHWRAILGEPLGPTKSAEAFVMVNLFGPEDLARDTRGMSLPKVPKDGFLHWYEKRELRPARKMGHMNMVGRSPSDIRGLLNELERCKEEWHRNLRGDE